MSSIKPQTLKGFRDFLPSEARKRQYVIEILKKVFESYGFEPLETPALEYEEILLGKYGDEGDKLMYRFKDRGKRKVALRYDQTVPLARVVAQYGSAGSPQALPMPFKRYQIQNVWRADNTQKGRYREFLQCDVDVVGSDSPFADAEILAMVYESYKKLGLDIVIKVNDRRLLATISAEAIGVIDKLNKIGGNRVLRELEKKGLSPKEAKNLLDQTKALKASVEITRTKEILAQMGVSKYILDYEPTLVRGLDYYTGLIFEVFLKNNSKGLSLGGGGRYDNLIGLFSGKKMPAVGFSFGFDRLIEAMTELKLFPDDLQATKVLVTVFSPELLERSIEVSSRLRSNNINVELYLDENSTLEKQLKYADKKGILYAIIIGPDEASKNMVTLRNMKTREQKTISENEIFTNL